MIGKVIGVSKSPEHTLRKQNEENIHLLEGLGVEGDAHMGKTVKHRSRVAQDPTQPNLRQVHLIHAELFEELKPMGFDIQPGQMGENITTSGINLLDLPKGTRMFLGETAVVEITGLRNPCNQLNGIQEGLMQAVLGRDENNKLIRKAGIMSIVLKSGLVKPGDDIRLEFPASPFVPLDKV